MCAAVLVICIVVPGLLYDCVPEKAHSAEESGDLASAAESPHTLCSFECCSCLRHSRDRCSWALRTTRSLAMAGQAFNNQDLVTLRQASLHDFPSDYHRIEEKKQVLLYGGG